MITLLLEENELKLESLISHREPQYLDIKRTDRLPKRHNFLVYLQKALGNGSKCELQINFKGKIWENTEGLFKSSYINEGGSKV